MLTVAYYFLQVTLCSAVMMGYYWLVLRNKRFHQYNRFYLLAIAVFSWVVPLLRIRWSKPELAAQPRVIRLLAVLADNNTGIDQRISHATQAPVSVPVLWSWDKMALTAYLIVAAVLLFGMLRGLLRLYRLTQVYGCKNVGDVYLVITRAKGTPFSFFRYIFWNDEIDAATGPGQQIMQHELTHVRQKHSLDKIIIRIILIAGWFNPFFWLLQREMEMIHEFIADKKAVNDGDTSSLAQMLLVAAYPQQSFLLATPFFFSPVKRRLQMLVINRHPRFSYLRRLVVLPLLAVVVVLFAFRTKEQRRNKVISLAAVMENVVGSISGRPTANPNIAVFDQAMLDRVYTVVINAGHGGEDKGFEALDGTAESDLMLRMAKAVQEQNTNKQIHIVLTRNSDARLSIQQLTELTNATHADLFLSLHCNKSVHSGIEMFLPNGKTSDSAGSYLLAQFVKTSIEAEKEKVGKIAYRTGSPISFASFNVPSLVFEAGSIDNPADLAKMKDAKYQQKIAIALLQGINEFLELRSHEKAEVKHFVDTVPSATVSLIANQWKLDLKGMPQTALQKALIVLNGLKLPSFALEQINPNDIQSINVLKGEKALSDYGEDGKNGVIEITTKSPGRIPLYVVDGEKIRPGAYDLAKFAPGDVDHISVLTPDKAVAEYGPEGRYGVIEVTTRKNNLRAVDVALDEVRDIKYPTGQNGFMDWGGQAKDMFNNIASNRKIYVHSMVYRGIYPASEKVLDEAQETTTDNNGIFHYSLGKGKPGAGFSDNAFDKIDWKRGPYYLITKTAVYPRAAAAWWRPEDYEIVSGTPEVIPNKPDQKTQNLRLFTRKGIDAFLDPMTTTVITIPFSSAKKDGWVMAVPQYDLSTVWQVWSAWIPEDGVVKVRLNNSTSKYQWIAANDLKLVLMEGNP